MESTTLALSVNSDITLDGDGHIISGNVAIYVNAANEETTIKDISFENISNSKNNLSPLYASSLSGKLTITGCTFINCNWDAIQSTPVDGAELIITDNFFETSDYAPKPNERFVHIQSAAGGVDFSATITRNKMIGSTVQSALEVYYPSDLSKIHISGNYISCINTGCILDAGGKNIGELAYPLVEEDLITEIENVVLTKDLYYVNGYASFAEGVEAVQEMAYTKKSLTLLQDAFISTSVELPSNVDLILDGYKFILEAGGSLASATELSASVEAASGFGVMQSGDADNGYVYTVFRVQEEEDKATGYTEVAPTVTENRAEVEIDSTVLNKTAEEVLTAAGEEKIPAIEVVIDTPENVNEVEIILPVLPLKTLNQSEKGELTISSGVGSITLDTAALTSIIAHSEEDQLHLKMTLVEKDDLTEQEQALVGDALVVDLSIYCGEQRISDFAGGSASLLLPYAPVEGESNTDVVVYYLEDSGVLTPCQTSYDAEAGKVAFVTGHFSKYVVGNSSLLTLEMLPYKDVLAEQWYNDAILYVYAHNLMIGVSEDSFAPLTKLNRAMVAVILYRLEGEPTVEGIEMPFTDVAADVYYADAVAWAYESGIFTGYNDECFGPEQMITREQIATVFYRYQTYQTTLTGETMNLDTFEDAEQISPWAQEAMSWAVESGLLNGVSQTRLNPQGETSRAQAAALLMRLRELA